MAADIITRLRRENPVTELPALDAGDLFAQIVASPRQRRRPRSSTPSRRRLALALLVVLAVAAPLALAARRAHVLGFAFGDPPPRHVVKILDTMLEPAYGPKEGMPQGATRDDIIRGSERQVAELTTSSGAVARMYAVDLRSGGFCWVTVGRPFGGGGCSSQARNDRFPLVVNSGSWGSPGRGRFGRQVTMYGRATSPRAATVAVYYADGATTLVPLSHTWLMYSVPEAHEVWGHEPTRMDVLAASGQVIGSFDDPFALHQPKVKAERPSGVQRLLARESLGWKGAFLELQTVTGSKGNQCARVVNTKDLVQTHNWWCGPQVGQTAFIDPGSTKKAPPVFFEFHQFTSRGLPGGYVYARGWVGPRITSLEIRFQDSTVQRIALHERLFMYVVPPDHWALGKRPSYAIGRDRSGRVLYRTFLYPRGRCSYPVADRRCANIIVHNG